MKKSKLLLSLLSLCFSLAVLCFGVYAANQVNYVMSGSISYLVTDAYVEVTTDVYKYGNYSNIIQNAPSKNSELASFYSSGHLEKISSSDYKQDSLSLVGNPASLTTTNLSALDLSLNTSDKKAIYVSVHIKNLGDNTVYSRVSSYTFEKISDNNEIEFASTNLMKYLTGGQTIASGETKEMLFALAIEDTTLGVQNLKFQYNLQISSQVYRNEYLKYDSQNHYYYVEMGFSSYTNATTNTPLKWRLVSIDGGVTTYTAPNADSNTVCHPTGDCMFVQDSAFGNDEIFLSGSKYNSNTGYHTNEGFLDRFANDYWSSDIRNIVTSNTFANVNQISSDANYKGSEIFANIQKRNIHNLYDNILETGQTYRYTPNNVTGKIDTDKLWLLSYDEASDLLIANTEYRAFWLRSCYYFSNITNCICYDNDFDYDGAGIDYAIRSAFIFII